MPEPQHLRTPVIGRSWHRPGGQALSAVLQAPFVPPALDLAGKRRRGLPRWVKVKTQLAPKRPCLVLHSKDWCSCSHEASKSTCSKYRSMSAPTDVRCITPSKSKNRNLAISRARPRSWAALHARSGAWVRSRLSPKDAVAGVLGDPSRVIPRTQARGVLAAAIIHAHDGTSTTNVWSKRWFSKLPSLAL